MAIAVVMPQLGLEVLEGTVTAFHCAKGDRVAKEQAVVELATDKVDTEVVAPCDGYVLALHANVGDTVTIGAVLLTLGDTPDDDGADLVTPATSPQQPLSESRRGVSQLAVSQSGAHTIRAASVARRMARDLGIDVSVLTGTGPRGRITVADVQAAARRAEATLTATEYHGLSPQQTLKADQRLEPLTRMRRTIARRMTASQREIPQFSLERSIAAEHLFAFKESQVAAGRRISLNDLLIQALADADKEHDLLRAAYVDGEEPTLRRQDETHVGLAVATPRGLVVPVIRDPSRKTLQEIASERNRLVHAARTESLRLPELTGGTITLSNLGGFGIDRFTAMVNPGESAILAVGRTIEQLVPDGRGIRVRPELTLTMTFDHRVIDGAVGAAALRDLANLLEGDMKWRT